MIEIIKNSENHMRVFKFICPECGCIYTATEDEGDLTFCFNCVNGNLAKLSVMCPMTFCKTENESIDVIDYM